MNQQPKNKKQPSQESLGPLNDAEIELIWLIRNKYRFGTIEIVTRDGFPVDILRTIERTRLGQGITYPQDSK